MPETPGINQQDFSAFDSMTDAELEEILRLDAQNIEGNESDTDQLLYIMEVLARRRKDSKDPHKTPEEALQSFKDHYLPDLNTEERSIEPVGNSKSAHRIPQWLRRLSATAAVLVLLVLGVTTTANAFGYNLFEIVVHWTHETFSLGTNDGDYTEESVVSNKWEYQSLQEALEADKITEPLVPTWLPDGYELETIEIVESPVQRKYLAVYRCNGQALKIQIKAYLTDDPQQIEQSGKLIETIDHYGISFYLFENVDQLRAVWLNGRYECYISGQLSVDEMKAIIDSIGEE